MSVIITLSLCSTNVRTFAQRNYQSSSCSCTGCSNKPLHKTFLFLSMKLNSSSSSLKYFAVVLLMVEETFLEIKTILQDHELEKHFNIFSLTFMWTLSNGFGNTFWFFISETSHMQWMGSLWVKETSVIFWRDRMEWTKLCKSSPRKGFLCCQFKPQGESPSIS